MKNDQSADRFGKSLDDPQSLVKAWQESTPGVSQADWAPLWASAVHRAATGEVPTPVAKPIIGRLALAASLLIAALAGWQLINTGNSQPDAPSIVSQDLNPEELTVITPGLVKIDLQEADDLAIIRLDDQACTADAPCLESVEAATAESGGTALAANFQLFNDLESIATDLR
jgi:hypothetical protein